MRFARCPDRLPLPTSFSFRRPFQSITNPAILLLSFLFFYGSLSILILPSDPSLKVRGKIMDLDDFRTLLESVNVDVWTLIDAAITVASTDYGDEIKDHRDRIVERLYSSSGLRCRNCDGNGRASGGGSSDGAARAAFSVEKDFDQHRDGKRGSPCSLDSPDGEEDDHPSHDLIDDEQITILAIKENLEDPHQSEESLVELLQTLADMDITFKALKETDIGRHVNHLRKHSSNDVRRLVKQLVRKWKDLVDEWVKQNTASDPLVASGLVAEGDSPQLKFSENSHHQVPDFSYSPFPHNGGCGSERSIGDPEPVTKALLRKEVPAKSSQAAPSSASAPHNNVRVGGEGIDQERLASARKRLQQNYQDAENAKKQRTIRVMDIHEIPKPKNGFFSKSKGSGGGVHHNHHGRYR